VTAALAPTAFTIAGSLLDVVRSAAAAANVPLPERQVIYFLPIPTDCEQVAVCVSGWATNPAVDELVPCMSFTWTVRLVEQIARRSCAVLGRGGKLPTAESMTEALRVASADAEVLRDVVARLSEVSDLEINMGAPQGAFQVVELLVTARGDGLL
jgi:hypothetical protein